MCAEAHVPQLVQIVICAGLGPAISLVMDLYSSVAHTEIDA